jgi:hypothetical protein
MATDQYEIDPRYEFDAPMAFDFSTMHDEEDADAWFERKFAAEKKNKPPSFSNSPVFKSPSRVMMGQQGDEMEIQSAANILEVIFQNEAPMDTESIEGNGYEEPSAPTSTITSSINSLPSVSYLAPVTAAQKLELMKAPPMNKVLKLTNPHSPKFATKQ